MKITQHIKERYVERVLKIEEGIEDYIIRNNSEVLEGILHLINGAKMLYENYSLQGSCDTNNILVHGNFIIIMSQGNRQAITLWDIFDEVENIYEFQELKDMINSIPRMENRRKRLNEQKNKQDFHSRKLENTFEWIIKNKSTIKSIWVEYHINSLETEIEDSIEKSKKILSEMKKIKREIREMMDKIMYGFKDSDKFAIHARSRINKKMMMYNEDKFDKVAMND